MHCVEGAGGDLRLMHIQTDNTLIQCCQFHCRSFRFTIGCGRWRMPELKVPEGDNLPMACLTCALLGSNPGFESVRRVTLDFGVEPPKICTTSNRHLPTRIFFHHQGWLQLQCPLDQYPLSVPVGRGP